jgi:tRNA(Ile)-lysidine synthase
MALCHALRAADRWAVFVATVDHGLRSGSADDAAFVVEQMHAWGLPAVALRPAATGAMDGAEGPEDAARRRRHAALETERRRIGAERIVYAHTADDQVETMLMRFASGAGAAGLAAMAPVAGVRARPWLSVRRSAVERYAAGEGVPYRDDPTNADLRFLRNRLRAELMPVFESVFGPAGVSGSLRTGRLARMTADALAVASAALPAEGPVVDARGATLRVPLGPFLAAPAALRRVAVHHWICAVYDAAGRARPRQMSDRANRVAAIMEGPAGRSVGGRDGFSVRSAGGLVTVRVEGTGPAASLFD